MKGIIRENLKRSRALLIVLVCILASFYVVKIYTGIVEDRIKVEGNITTGVETSRGRVPAGGIYGERKISQGFFSTKRNLIGFSIEFATYARVNYCSVLVELIDTTDSNKKVFSQRIDGSKLTDNAYQDFLFEGLKNSKNHKYLINISSYDTLPENAVTVYLSEGDHYSDGQLMVEGKIYNGDLNFKVYFEKYDISTLELLVKFFSVLLIFSICIYLYYRIEYILQHFGKKLYFIISLITFFLCSSVIISEANESIYMTLNFKGITVCLIWIILLILFEKKLHYVRWIKENIESARHQMKMLKEEKDIKKLFLYQFGILSNVFFVGCFALFSSFCWNMSCVVFVFMLGTITISLNILNSVFIKKSKPSFIFLTVSILLGMIMSFTFQPKASAIYDGSIHYENAAALRQILFDRNYTVADWYMIAANYDRPEYISGIESIEHLMLLNDQEKSTGFLQPINLYHMVAYIPVALIMALSDAVGNDFLKMIVFSRLTNSVIYSMVVYYGLKRLKSGIYLLSSICLMPLFLFISAQFTYDYWVTAFILYGITYLISELQDASHMITMKDCIAMFGAIFLGCGPKMIYCVLLILFLFVPEEKFLNRKSFYKYKSICILILFAILVMTVVPFFLSPGTGDLRGGMDVAPKQQVEFIFSNPLHYTSILLKYMSQYMSLKTFIAWIGEFAYMGSGDPFFVTICSLIVGFCMFVDKNENDRFKNITEFRIATWGVVFIQIALICTALYISFTPVGFDTINGVQYRYVFPFLFPLLYSVGSPKITREIDSKVMDIIVFGGMAVSVIGSVFVSYLIKVV